MFLHHQEFVCDLPASSRINLYGLDGQSTISGLPGISERLLAPAQRSPVSEEGSPLLAELMKAIGLVPRRQREVGSWVIDEHPLADGEGMAGLACVPPRRRRAARAHPFLHTRAGEPPPEISTPASKPSPTSTTCSRGCATTVAYRCPKISSTNPSSVSAWSSLSPGDTPLDPWLAEHQDDLSLEDQL